MKRKANTRLDLKLNLSPPPRPESPRLSASSEVSGRSSCVSMEVSSEEIQTHQLNSPEASSMVLVGCPRCLMYVMLSEVDRKCPKCKSSVLLDFLSEEHTKRAGN